MLIYFLSITGLIAISAIALAIPKNVPAMSSARRCPRCGASLSMRRTGRDAGEWACGSCGCDSDEFGNKLYKVHRA
jgi:ribosomal protein L37AE/L43A